MTPLGATKSEGTLLLLPCGLQYDFIATHRTS